jgi:hypothetical protein
MIEPRGAATAKAGFEKPATLNAPLFRGLVERLDPEKRLVVLDLGAAETRTIAFFGRFRCRIDIADIGDGIEALNADRDAETLPGHAESLLTVRHEEPTDLVLCWDLLNYLEPAALAALTTAMAGRARAGALMHALIAYSESSMPMSPGRYVPLEDGRLHDLAPPRAERPARRYTPDDLRRHLPGCKIERAMLLANGMQEFLFRL